MIKELFGLLASADVTSPTKGKFDINLNRNRIRSISSFSNKNIFYFPTVVSDQCTIEEVTMISRALEKQYASFVVACISLMPFHRIHADDRGSIEEYLSQFHQNLGVNSSDAIVNGASRFLAQTESVVPADAQDFFYRVWQESLAENCDFYTYMTENYIPLSEMYNKDAVDPYTKLLQKRYNETVEELDTWGFIGDADDDDFDSEDDDDDDDIEDGYEDSILDNINEGVVKQAIDNIKFTLEGVSENKIMSCSSLTKLRSLESKLKSLKSKYTKYLNRYKKKYNENKKSGKRGKLAISFNKMTISDPKAFMQQYSSYIKIINKRLKLCEKRRAELVKRKGGVKAAPVHESVDVINELSSLDFAAIDKLDESISADLRARDSEIFTIIDEASKDVTDDDIEAEFERQHSDNYVTTGQNVSAARAAAANEKRRADEFKNMSSRLDRQNKAYRDELEKMTANATTNRNRNRAMATEMRAMQKTMDAQTEELTRLRRNGRGSSNRSGSGSDKFEISANYDRRRHKNDINPAAVVGAKTAEFKSFDRDVFTNMDMKKSNDMVPTFTHATIGFVIDETEEVVSRDVMVGIKTYIHKAPTAELVNDIANTIQNKRKFLKFVKFITGEERSLADLIFGFKELKTDAMDSRKAGSQWRSAFKRRKRWSKMTIPYLTKEYTPNGTIVMTMNEVDYIRDTYGIDLMKNNHCKMIMDNNFLLGFVILDQANEIAYVMYDGQTWQFQEYTYNMLEREQQMTDRMMRELYRSFSR